MRICNFLDPLKNKNDPTHTHTRSLNVNLTDASLHKVKELLKFVKNGSQKANRDRGEKRDKQKEQNQRSKTKTNTTG